MHRLLWAPLLIAGAQAFQTSCQADGGNSNTGELIFLDRVGITCPAGAVLVRYNLNRCSQHTWQYNYDCEGVPILSSTTHSTGCSDDGGSNVVYLDRHSLSCPGGAMSSFRLTPCGGGRLRYDYTCANIATTTSTSLSTSCSSDGGGNPHFLDRHRLDCGLGNVMAGFQLQRCGNTDMRFDYTCNTLPIQLLGDPHLSLAHGGKADFRGENGGIYNFLSAKNLALNVMTEMADFELHPADHPRHKDVHGSFITQAHVVARTSTGKTVRVSFFASEVSTETFPNSAPKNQAVVNGTVDSEPAFKLLGIRKHEKEVDDVLVRMTYSSLHFITTEFEIVVSVQHFRLERNVTNLHHRLDVSIKPRVAEAAFAVPPHGIVGQSWDGDGLAIDGEQDAFPVSGEFTTYAMAKGAIEGVPNDYKVPQRYSTDFKYSRFDATSAEPRNVAKLVAAGELNAPKVLHGGDVVGTTENTEEKM